MFAFNWPLIIVTTIVLYVLTILFLPLSTVYATIMLFSLIAFWSQLPGFCIMEPVRFLYMMDFVDIFSVIIAIYVGPFQAAGFALFWNVYPRLCGAYLSYIAIIKDGLAQAILCFFVPVFFAITGGDLLMVVIIFSILRLPLFFLLCLIVPHRSIPEQLFHIAVAGAAVLIINSFYAKIFGDFFSSLLFKGASFSWILFLVATIVILVFAITVFGFSPKRAASQVGGNLFRMARKRRRKKKQTQESQHHSREMDEMKRIKESI